MMEHTTEMIGSAYGFEQFRTKVPGGRMYSICSGQGHVGSCFVPEVIIAEKPKYSYLIGFEWSRTGGRAIEGRGWYATKNCENIEEAIKRVQESETKDGKVIVISYIYREKM